ncbi:hypothetical protein, partial [Alkaliphilus transvaalensis]|uniref:hypothetical protein n=1 Tax=Alkaliphilus transvaalensis TaxID=114628 RepID=UPI001A9A442F
SDIPNLMFVSFIPLGTLCQTFIIFFISSPIPSGSYFLCFLLGRLCSWCCPVYPAGSSRSWCGVVLAPYVCCYHFVSPCVFLMECLLFLFLRVGPL